jgi:hypothetical protein
LFDVIIQRIVKYKIQHMALLKKLHTWQWLNDYVDFLYLIVFVDEKQVLRMDISFYSFSKLVSLVFIMI